jgi:hypothetical protein
MQSLYVMSSNASNTSNVMKFQTNVNSSGYPFTQLSESSAAIRAPKAVATLNNLATLLQNGFGLDFGEFREMLKREKAVLAGSSTLWTLSPWCEYQHFDGDLDIWIQRSQTNDDRQEFISRLMTILNRSKYVLQNKSYTKGLQNLDEEYDVTKACDVSFKDVNVIHTFISTITYRGLYKEGDIKKTRKIQFILLNISPAKMVEQFDIDLTRCYWDGEVMKTFFSASALKSKEFCLYATCTDDKRKKHRIAKYERRGFTWSSAEVDMSDLYPVNKNSKNIVNVSKAKTTETPVKVSASLSSLLSLTSEKKYTKTEITNLFMNYLLLNKLYHPEQRQRYLCTGPMFDLFGVIVFTEDDFETMLSPHLIEIKDQEYEIVNA